MIRYGSSTEFRQANPLPSHVEPGRGHIKSGVLPTKCRYNSAPVEAQLGVAFGALHWETTKAGDPNRCTANTPSPAIGHLLDSFQVYMSCDIGPLGDNAVTARATGIDLLVPFEMTPPTFSQEVPN